MNLEDFRIDFIENIRNDSIIQGLTPSQVFLETMVAQLENMDYLFNSEFLNFYKPGNGNKIMKFDVYSYDESEKSLILLYNDYLDDDNTYNLTQSEINIITLRMKNYVEETYNGSIFKHVDPSQDIYKFSVELNKQLNQNFITIEDDTSIERLKFYIITNKKLSKRVSNLKLDDLFGKQVELNVWDIERVYDIFSSGKDKEPLLIDLAKHNNKMGIPFLQANFDQMTDYDAYLCVLPGKVLSDIYWEHGSRLLEGNVRTFLSNRGKVNKGIRYTIKNEPNKFFTYNNGIACTAKEIIFSPDGRFIEKIKDLQIINGGQTTASLTSASKKDKAELENIYVPMKLTIIKSGDYEDMVQNIAKYANSQNKVTDADLFSNHPFHVRLEKLSQSNPAPAKRGEVHNTYWYYERSRGKYQNEMFKILTKSNVDDFKKKYPRSQVIVKEDLAKYIMAGMLKRPDLVSKGRAKNMIEFAKHIDAIWKKNENKFGNKYFQNAVVYAIIFKTIDVIVKKAEWYNIGGVKLNIIPYTISKIMSTLPNGYTIDFNRIWKNQELYESFLCEANKLAKIANEFLNDSKGVIVTEYAKKEETWNKFNGLRYEFSKAFLDDLVNIELLKQQEESSTKDQVEYKKISIENQIFELAQKENGNYWHRLISEGLNRNLITYKEKEIIEKYICELAKKNPKNFPTPQQYKIAWKVREKLEENGVLI
jgi:hypothetical protein